jgi:isopentenyldiphosphate isomerase
MLTYFRSGFEQANKYVIMDAQGNHIGYMAEQEKGMANAMARQWFRTHRSFVTHVFDKHENEVLRVSQASRQGYRKR